MTRRLLKLIWNLGRNPRKAMGEEPMAATPQTGICWFCGQGTTPLKLGWSLPIVVESDYRLECPQEGEFPENRGLGQGSAPAAICTDCVQRYRLEVGVLSEEYVKKQRIMEEELHVQDADVSGGLLESDHREVRYGCWFGKFPILPQTRRCEGLTLAELHDRGVPVLGSRYETSRIALDSFFARAGVTGEVVPVSGVGALGLTQFLSLRDGTLTLEDRMRCCNARVWILDATLVLDSEEARPRRG